MLRFAENIKSEKAFFFYRGGTALYASLKAMGVGPGDQVISPVFTCPAVPHPIVRLGATPIYVDIDPRTFNIDPNQVEAKMTSATRAIIVQHTFGIPADMDSILDIARKHDVWVVEDACHALGSRYKGQEVGTFGDVAFYSFGWYKPLTLGVGGSAVVNNPLLKPKIVEVHEQFVTPTFKELVVLYLQYFAYSWLVNPATFWLLKEIYRRLSIAGIISGTSRRTKDVSSTRSPYAVEPGDAPFKGKTIIPYQEKRLFRKLDRWDDMIAHQEWIVSRYRQGLSTVDYTPFELESHLEPVYYKYPVLSDHKNEIFERARQTQIEMSDMFGSPLYPPDRKANWEALGYKEGMCPHSERASERIIALPVHAKVRSKDIETTVALLASFW
jgi:perosamine synthetase